MIEFDDSPVVALNRAVALAEVHGPQAGIETVGAIQNLRSLKSDYLLYAVLGEFEVLLNHSQAAAAHFRKSLQLAKFKSEQVFLSKRLQYFEGVSVQATALFAPGSTRSNGIRAKMDFLAP